MSKVEVNSLRHRAIPELRLASTGGRERVGEERRAAPEVVASPNAAAGVLTGDCAGVHPLSTETTPERHSVASGIPRHAN